MGLTFGKSTKFTFEITNVGVVDVAGHYVTDAITTDLFAHIISSLHDLMNLTVTGGEQSANLRNGQIMTNLGACQNAGQSKVFYKSWGQGQGWQVM